MGVSSVFRRHVVLQLENVHLLKDKNKTSPVGFKGSQ